MMKKQLLWASLLLSLTFTQQSEATLATAVPHSGVLDADFRAIKARVGPATMRVEINDLSASLGYLDTDATAALGLDDKLQSHLSTISTNLGTMAATVGTHTTLDTVAADILTIDVTGLTRLQAGDELGETVLSVGSILSDYQTAVNIVQGKLVTSQGADITVDIGVAASKIITAPGGVSLEADLITLSGRIVDAPLGERELEIVAIGERLVTTPASLSLEAMLVLIDTALGGTAAGTGVDSILGRIDALQLLLAQA
jgi:hypothetical protein